MADQEEFPPKPYIFIVSAIAALNNCNLGYDLGVTSAVGPLLLRQPDYASVQVSPVQLELFVGLIDLASLFGAVLSHFLADKFGRKGCMSISAVIFVLSVLGMGLSWDYASLMFFRFCTGVGVGIGLAIGPLYISELAPEDYRGKLVSWTELATNVGIVLGFLAGYVLEDMPITEGWRVMLGLGSIMPAILLICLFFMPESPRWLVRNDSIKMAHGVLTNIYHDEVDVDPIVEEIQDALEVEGVDDEGSGNTSWEAIYDPSSSMKGALLAGIGMAMIQQLSGIEAITSYFVFILEAAGIQQDQSLLLVFFGISKLITVFAIGYALDHPNIGRKSLLLSSAGGMLLSMFLLVLVFHRPFHVGPFWAVTALVLYVVSYSLGVGPATWVVCAEVFPLHVRAKAVSVTTFINRLTATAVSGSFLTMTAMLSYKGYFLLFLGITLSSLLFMYEFIPETQGVSLERINELFLVVDFDELSTHSKSPEKAIKQSSSLQSMSVRSYGSTSSPNKV